MADDRTTVTELATALGMLGHACVGDALAARPPVLVNLTTLEWDRLDALWAAGDHGADFRAGFDNGGAFLAAPGALRGRVPALIEWKGAHKSPGDEPVPADLRVDHVYLVSCKYLSRNLHNRSPSRVFDRLLGPGDTDAGDWYLRSAPVQYQALYQAAAAAVGLEGLPGRVEGLTSAQRLVLRAALRARAWPAPALVPYAELCQAVSAFTARHWSERIAGKAAAEALVWRLLRIGGAPYFILGSDERQPLRLRIEKATGHTKTVAGHVEIRWSHGRFAGNPEAKVYLDTAHHEVPGYVEL